MVLSVYTCNRCGMVAGSIAAIQRMCNLLRVVLVFLWLDGNNEELL